MFRFGLNGFSSYAALATIFASAVIACSSPTTDPDPSQADEGNVQSQQEELNGQQLLSELRGGVDFFLGFAGTQDNGRTCSTCHVAEDAFALTPAHVEERWQELQHRRARNPRADDPLFRSIDADDFANDFTRLRQNALIRVNMTLPTNGAGEKLMWPVDDPAATSVAVFRSVPTVLNVAFTGPYQLDGRKQTLQAQALAALHDHSQIQREPTARSLDDVSAFQSALFSSPAVRDLSNALANGRPIPPTDPPLNALEQQGKALFNGFCTVACHTGPTQNKPAPPFANRQNILVARPLPPFVPPALAATFLPSPLTPRLWAFKNPAPGGPPIVIPSTDPGKALLTGNPADIGQFDQPSLYGISKTAPYFHDNSAKTLEDVMQHYVAFFQFLQLPQVTPPDGAPRPPPIQPEMVAPMVAYLKKL